jgi:hypothetical protein
MQSFWGGDEIFSHQVEQKKNEDGHSYVVFGAVARLQ